MERLDEEEQAARAWPEDQRVWQYVGRRNLPYDNGRSQNVAAIDVSQRLHAMWDERICIANAGDALAEHVVRWDPAHVLAEVAAKRKLADLHTRIILHGGGGAAWYDKTAICRSCAPSKQFPETAWPCQTICVLAAPYADHPHYDQAWRPEGQ